jgi:preprotein translocase subunit SecD
MKIRWQRFNLYLLMAVAAAMVCGCRTSSAEKKSKKLVSTLRLHLEMGRDRSNTTEVVPIYRRKPIMVNVEKVPFLTEAEVAEAKVIDVDGDFALSLKFDHPGTALYEAYTTANRGRRIAVFSQFGEQIKTNRWLAAPIISRRVTDGVFTFTPDTTREEAEVIALGLNNVAKKIRSSWIEQ